MIFRTNLFCLLTIICVVSNNALLAIAQEAKPEPTARKLLVNANWLSDHIDEVRLISLGQTPEEFDKGHIPQSVFVDWKTEITDPANTNLFNLPPKAKIETLLSKLGVTPETTVVLSDNRSNRISTRLYWTLKTHGHRDVRILDGGVGAWQASGRKISTRTLAFESTQYKCVDSNEQYVSENFADTRSVRNAIERGDVLIDGRPTPQYTGADPGIAFHTNLPHQRRGHIKSAINIPWKENFTADGKFKSAGELRELYENAGVMRNRKIVTYCNEGLHAAPAWFVLKELLKYPDVKLYDDSMGVWANRFDTPMTQTEAMKD